MVKELDTAGAADLDSSGLPVSPPTPPPVIASFPFRISVVLVVAVACARAEQQPATDTAANTTATTQPAVEILSPANGDSVTLPVTIRLGATSVVVVPATGTREEGKGHHHLVVDGDAPSDTLPLPKPPLAIHLGNGASERALDSLPPGPHRVIAIFASGDHVPMTGVRRDTVTFIVR